MEVDTATKNYGERAMTKFPQAVSSTGQKTRQGVAKGLYCDSCCKAERPWGAASLLFFKTGSMTLTSLQSLHRATEGKKKNITFITIYQHVKSAAQTC